MDDPLALTLGSIYAAAPAPPAPARSTTRRPRRGRGARRNKTAAAPPRARDDDDDVRPPPPPFPWARNLPGRHETLAALLRRGVTSVEGSARCRRCGARRAVAYALEPRFRDLRRFVDAHRHAMADRAPDAWLFPALPDCDACGQKGALAPEIAKDKRAINWLFLLLGQTLGCCTLDQLRYLCMTAGKHRTGAKDRVLYDAYMELLNQLEPFGGDGNKVVTAEPQPHN